MDGIPDTSLAYYNTNCPVVLSILEAAPFYETFETILGPHGIEKPTNAQSACPATAGGGRRRLVSVRNLLQGSPAPSSETQGDVHIIPDPFKDLKDSLADATRFVHARLLHVQGSWAEAHAGALQRREERRGRVAYRSEGEASKDTTGHVVGWLMGSIHGALSGMRVPEGYAQEVAGGARSPAKARAPEQSLASQEGEEGRSRAARGLLGTLNNAVQEGAASLNLDVTCPLLARVATGVATSVDIAASYYGGRYQESLRDALPAFHAFSPMEATTCQPPTFPPERLGELVRSVPRTPASAAPWSRVPWPSVPSEGNTSLLSICLQGPAGAEEGGVANGTRPRRSGRVETDPTVDFAGARLLARVWDWLEAILGACIMEGEAPSLAAVGDALVAWSKGLLGDVQGAAVDLLSCEDYDTVVACEHEHRLGGLRLLRSAASVAWPLALGALVTIAMGGSGVLSCMAFVAPVVAVLCAWAVLYDTYGWGPGCSSGLPVCLADDVVSTADSLLGMEVVWPAALRKGQVTGVSRGGGGCDACFDPPLFVNCAVDTGIADPLRATAYLVHRAWPTEVALVVAELRDALPFLARYVETLAGRAEVAPDTYMACAGVALVPSLPLLAFMVWPVTSALVAVVQMVVALAVRSFRLTFYCLVALYLGLAAVEDAAF